MDNNRLRIILNNKQEFRKLFDLYYPALCLYALAIVHDNFLAEDLVQEVFITLWEKSDDFDNMHAIRTFLYTSVKNKCLNILEHEKVIRKHKEYVQHELMNDTLLNNQIIEEETHRLIYTAINELPSECRNILLLGISGLKNKEIAEELQLSVNTVKTQKKIAYRYLKIKLKDIYLMAGLLLGSVL